MKASFRPLGYGLRLVVAGLVLFCGSLAVGEKLTELPKPTDYVSDYAQVLSPEAIAQIDHICSEIEHSAANAQIAVVTIHTLDGEDRDDYVNRLYHQMGIGAKGKDRGILIFLSVNDHQRRIEVGFGLEGILPDAKVGDIGRSAVGYLRANDYDQGILTQVSQVAQVIAADANVTLSDEAATQAAPRRARRGSPFGGLIVLIIVLVFFGGSWIVRLLFGGLLLNSLGGWRGGGWGGGGGWGSGGGWGGGGGDSGGGGGFGGFGGGDSGGGGAGGSW